MSSTLNIFPRSWRLSYNRRGEVALTPLSSQTPVYAQLVMKLGRVAAFSASNYPVPFHVLTNHMHCVCVCVHVQDLGEWYALLLRPPEVWGLHEVATWAFMPEEHGGAGVCKSTTNIVCLTST